MDDLYDPTVDQAKLDEKLEAQSTEPFELIEKKLPPVKAKENVVI